jgi:uncharacterized protein with HEPN domain
MDDRDREHLGNLIIHAEAAIGYARAHGRGWWRSAETLDAVLMRISQVGEAATTTSPEALAGVPGVTWRDVKGIRAKIVHDYETIDVLVIRGVVSRQLPRLITSVYDATPRVAGDDQAAAATTRIELCREWPAVPRPPYAPGDCYDRRRARRCPDRAPGAQNRPIRVCGGQNPPESGAQHRPDRPFMRLAQNRTSGPCHGTRRPQATGHAGRVRRLARGRARSGDEQPLQGEGRQQAKEQDR